MHEMHWLIPFLWYVQIEITFCLWKAIGSSQSSFCVFQVDQNSYTSHQIILCEDVFLSTAELIWMAQYEMTSFWSISFLIALTFSNDTSLLILYAFLCFVRIIIFDDSFTNIEMLWYSDNFFHIYIYLWKVIVMNGLLPFVSRQHFSSVRLFLILNGNVLVPRLWFIH